MDWKGLRLHENGWRMPNDDMLDALNFVLTKPNETTLTLNLQPTSLHPKPINQSIASYSF